MQSDLIQSNVSHRATSRLSSHRLVLIASLLGVTALTTACGDDNDNTAPLVATNLQVVRGNSQTAVVGTALTDSLAILVRTASGQAVRNVPVTWTVVSGGGTLSAATTTSDAEGRTAVAYTAGTTVGPSVVTASVNGVTPIEFQTTLVAAAASAIVADTTTALNIPLDAAPTPLQVKVTDSFGNPVAGVTVSWSVVGGDGTDSFDAATSTTDANGMATVNYDPAGMTGTRTLSVSTSNGLSWSRTVTVIPTAGIQR